MGVGQRRDQRVQDERAVRVERRPWAGRWCPTCNTWPRPGSRHPGPVHRLRGLRPGTRSRSYPSGTEPECETTITCSKSRALTEPLEHLQQRFVDHDRPILGVGDDEAQLVAVQPRVERVQHRSHRGHREVHLEMLGLIPHQRGHGVAGLDAEAGQRRSPAGGRAARTLPRVVRWTEPSGRRETTSRAGAEAARPARPPPSATAGSRPSSGPVSCASSSLTEDSVALDVSYGPSDKGNGYPTDAGWQPDRRTPDPEGRNPPDRQGEPGTAGELRFAHGRARRTELSWSAGVTRAGDELPEGISELLQPGSG